MRYIKTTKQTMTIYLAQTKIQMENEKLHLLLVTI